MGFIAVWEGRGSREGGHFAVAGVSRSRTHACHYFSFTEHFLLDCGIIVKPVFAVLPMEILLTRYEKFGHTSHCRELPRFQVSTP